MTTNSLADKDHDQHIIDAFLTGYREAASHQYIAAHTANEAYRQHPTFSARQCDAYLNGVADSEKGETFRIKLLQARGHIA